MFAGTAVALAISLGAYVVYERAKYQKLNDVRRHLFEMSRRLSKANNKQALEINPIADLTSSLSFVRDNATEARRIYTFALNDVEQQTRIDTGLPNEQPGARPLPAHARRAREYFKHDPRNTMGPVWSLSDGLDFTVFSKILDHQRQGTHVLAIEADTHQLLVGLSTIRQALWFTCFLGLFAGGLSAFVVHRMRSRAAIAQAQLDESLHVEEALIASLGEAVYTYDPTAARFHWRGNIQAFLGFLPDAEGGSLAEWMDRLHPEDRSRYTAALEAAMATTNAQPMNLEYRLLINHAGQSTTIWVLDRSQPVQLKRDHSLLAGSLTDLTAHRRAAETLRIFFEGTATAHLALDGDTIVDANPAALELFAAPDKRTLLSQPGWSLWPRRQPTHALSVAAWSEAVMTALENGSSRFDWQFLRIDGSLVDCDVFMRPTIFHDRKVLMMDCSDISRAKLAQAQLIESEQRFRDVSGAIGEFIWEVDRDTHYTYASPRVRDVLGLEPNEVLGCTPFEFVPLEDLEAVKERSQAILQEGIPFRNFEHRVRRADGALLWISVSGVPCYNASGAITGYRGASLNITQHRAYEQELVLQKNAAEAAARAKSSFLAMMSHEIRTPLNSVLGFADLLLDTSLTAIQRDYLQTIQNSGDALLVLLNDILDFSKIESGQMEVEIRPTELSRCIREVFDLYAPGAAAKDLPLTSHIAPDVPPHILTDPSRLRQILVNLVGNAVKFTASGGIYVEVSRRPPPQPGADERIRILVADSGIGVSKEQRERLFKPFTQADSSTTRRFGGTGLGLAISKRLAHLLGGDLGLETNDGPGARFFIELPALLPAPQEFAPKNDEAANYLAGPRASRLGGHTPQVLVVDDNTLNRRLTSKLLHQLGAETDTAASAEECFEKVIAGHYDFVLMDVQMPGTDGLQATQHLRSLEAQRPENQQPLPIIALTADAMVGDRDRCLAAGMTDYLTKPLRREDLMRVLDTYGAHSQA